MTLRNATAELATRVVNVIIAWLRNGRSLELSREEIRHVKTSFSQFGEDLLVKGLLEKTGTHRGTYVDVGAFHPVLFSNTLSLWKAGFRGVNIDMNADKIAVFNTLRPDDWNVCAAVSDASHPYSRSANRDAMESIAIGGDVEGTLRTVTLDSILAGSPFRGQVIDYLNIDCEGQDLAVLKSLSLDVYRPQVITIETLTDDVDDEIRVYLQQCGYDLVANAGLTRLFVRRDRA